MIRYSKPYVSKFSKMVSSEDNLNSFISELSNPSSTYMKVVNKFISNSNIPLEISFTRRVDKMAEGIKTIANTYSSTPLYIHSNGFTKEEIKELLIIPNVAFINMYYFKSINRTADYKDLPDILAGKLFNRIVISMDDNLFELGSVIDLKDKHNEYVITLSKDEKEMTEEELEKKYFNSPLFRFISDNKWMIPHLIDLTDIIYGHRSFGFSNMSLDSLFLYIYKDKQDIVLNTNEIIQLITDYKYSTFINSANAPETREEKLLNLLYDLIAEEDLCYPIYCNHSEIYRKYWREMKYPKKKRHNLNILCDIEETIHPNINDKEETKSKRFFPIYIQPYTSDKAYKTIFNKEEIFHITPQEIELYEGELVKVSIWNANLFNIVLVGIAEDVKKMIDTPDNYSIHNKITDAVIQKFIYKKKKNKESNKKNKEDNMED